MLIDLSHAQIRCPCSYHQNPSFHFHFHFHLFHFYFILIMIFLFTFVFIMAMTRAAGAWTGHSGRYCCLQIAKIYLGENIFSQIFSFRYLPRYCTNMWGKSLYPRTPILVLDVFLQIAENEKKRNIFDSKSKI